MSQHDHTESSKALDKAADAIENAKYNLKGGYFAATANRAYYSCYYCILALLYTHNVYAKTHHGARAKFSELFIKSGILPVDMSEHVTTLFDYRQEADYDLDEDITQEEGEDLIRRANEVYLVSRDYFQQLIADLS